MPYYDSRGDLASRDIVSQHRFGTQKTGDSLRLPD
jgi:hypothetical protein